MRSITSARRTALNPRRIAVMRALQLGDLILSVPALRALRRQYPDAEITFIGLPWARSYATRFSTYIDRFVEFPGWPGIAETDYLPMRTHLFLREQRAYGYDLAIQMHGSGEASNPFVLALGAHVTAGYYRDMRPDGLTLAEAYPDDQPEVLRCLGLAELVGCHDLSHALEFSLSQADRAEAAKLLSRLSRIGGPRVAIHAGARSPARRWPLERYAAVADTLVERYAARIVLTGGPGEECIARAVEERMRTRPLNLAGTTTIGGLAALIAGMDLFISNDTGPAHIACAVDTPSITLFGPADMVRWAPLDRVRHPIVRRPVACSPCSYWECPIDHRCLRWIPTDAVIDAAAGLLAGKEALCGA